MDQRINLVACHAYQSSDSRHLNFPAGACILAKPGQDGNPLWLGTYAGRRGWFPPSYCRMQPCVKSPNHRSNLRTRSLDDYDFARDRQFNRPGSIELRSKSLNEKTRNAPVNELFLPVTPKAGRRSRTALSGASFFSRVDRIVEELEVSELSLPELPNPSSSSSTLENKHPFNGHKVEENSGISTCRQDIASCRATPTRSRASPRRTKKSPGASLLQGLKDIRNIASPRKSKKKIATVDKKPSTGSDLPKKGSNTSTKLNEDRDPPVTVSPGHQSLPAKLDDPVPIDPIEVVAAAFWARQQLTPSS